MLLTVSTTMPQATDLGFLLHKHPDRVQHFAFTAGSYTVCYPEATDDRCTAALLLDVDPVSLLRGKGRQPDTFTLGQYVNDRPYAASSLLAVALGKAFGTAMSGRCKARPELVDQAIPLIIEVPCLPSRGGPDLAERLFAPMGWAVQAQPIALDPQLPEWGDSPYVALRLTGELRLADALHHLYVLLPVLDGSKHYWVSPDEVDKLITSGSGWLGDHPERELITRRYLKNQAPLWRDAMSRLAELDDVPESEAGESPRPGPSLARQRRDTVLEAVRELRPRRVLDLGCGEGALLGPLLAEQGIDQVVGVDVSAAALTRAEKKLHLDTMTERQRDRLTLWQSSLIYRDQRLSGFDVAILMEVIEHIDPDRLEVVEGNVFANIRPASVIITTPNREFNAHYPRLTGGGFRHPDHRFEWDRAEFARWSDSVAQQHGYVVERRPVGERDLDHGPSTQMAVFRLANADEGVA